MSSVVRWRSGRVGAGARRFPRVTRSERRPSRVRSDAPSAPASPPPPPPRHRGAPALARAQRHTRPPPSAAPTSAASGTGSTSRRGVGHPRRPRHRHATSVRLRPAPGCRQSAVPLRPPAPGLARPSRPSRRPATSAASAAVPQSAAARYRLWRGLGRHVGGSVSHLGRRPAARQPDQALGQRQLGRPAAASGGGSGRLDRHWAGRLGHRPRPEHLRHQHAGPGRFPPSPVRWPQLVSDRALAALGS